MRTEDALRIVGEVCDHCGGLFPGGIHDAYLYGSYARGDQDSESDVDILLTVDAGQEQLSGYREEVAAVTSELSLAHDVTVSVTVKSLEQFTRFAGVLPYYQNVLREGIRYGR